MSISLFFFLSIFSTSILLGYVLTSRPTIQRLNVLFWFVILLPYSDRFGNIVYINGVNSTDGILIGALLVLLNYNAAKARIKIKFILAGVAFFALVLINILMSVDEFGSHLPTVILDLKILLYVPVLYFIAKTIRKRTETNCTLISNSKILGMLTPLFVVASVKSILISYGLGLGLFNNLASDTAMALSDSTFPRYSDLSLPFMYSILLSMSTKRFVDMKFSYNFILIAVSFLTVVAISGSRTFLVSGLLCLGYLSFRMSLLFGISFFCAGIAALFFLFLLSDWSVALRFATLLDLDSVTKTLETRLSPFFSEYTGDWGVRELLIGFSLGSSFVIPWFEYRGLSPDLAVIDNIYLSIFLKYGFFGVLTLVAIVLGIFSSRHFTIVARVFSLLSISIVGLTMSVVYQSYFVITAFSIVVLSTAVLYPSSTVARPIV